jgi:hypothetical protein
LGDRYPAFIRDDEKDADEGNPLAQPRGMVEGAEVFMKNGLMPLVRKHGYYAVPIVVIWGVNGAQAPPDKLAVFYAALFFRGVISGLLSGLVAALAWRRVGRATWAYALTLCLPIGMMVGGVEWVLVGALAGSRNLGNLEGSFLGLAIGLLNAGWMLWRLSLVTTAPKHSAAHAALPHPVPHPHPVPVRPGKGIHPPGSKVNGHQPQPTTSDRASPSPALHKSPSSQWGHPLESRLEHRLELITTLCALTPTEFNQVVFTLHPPEGVVPPSPAAQGDRAAALLQWLEGPTGCGLESLQQILDTLRHHP